ncbi:hypothetical protein M378DRAFT_169092 [Amanita muscaria Koide BX008]|uniref:Uncharacterized protein n=1 Tax=Amanita muscaria (strain Koide BX008) TaxID=946122 RepID=A0A0C2WDZ9_AMAMK|nr:hypothetical protein M378DRAFT_169092 [Amanita muscaria Koide BX008]
MHVIFGRALHSREARCDVAATRTDSILSPYSRSHNEISVPTITLTSSNKRYLTLSFSLHVPSPSQSHILFHVRVFRTIGR